MLDFSRIVGFSSRLFYLLAYALEDPDDPDKYWTGIYSFSHGKWNTLGDFPDVWLVDLDVVGEDHLVAVSIWGEIYEYRRGSWTTTKELMEGAACIKAFGMANYYIAGSGGLLGHFSSGKLKKIKTGTKEDFFAISGLDNDSFLVVGANGTCVRKTGSTCYKENTKTKVNLTRVEQIDDNRAFAVGWKGRVMSRDHKGWRRIPSPVDWYLTGISVVSKSQLYCAGMGLLNIEDGTATVEIDPTEKNVAIFDILGIRNGKQIVVGANEMILMGPPWRRFSPKFRR